MHAIKILPSNGPEIVKLSSGVQAELAGAPCAKIIDPAGMFYAFVDDTVQNGLTCYEGCSIRATGELLYGTVIVTRRDRLGLPRSVHAEDVGRIIGLLKGFIAILGVS